MADHTITGINVQNNEYIVEGLCSDGMIPSSGSSRMPTGGETSALVPQ